MAILLNEINMDVFLKYFTKEYLSSSNLEPKLSQPEIRWRRYYFITQDGTEISYYTLFPMKCNTKDFDDAELANIKNYFSDYYNKILPNFRMHEDETGEIKPIYISSALVLDRPVTSEPSIVLYTPSRYTYYEATSSALDKYNVYYKADLNGNTIELNNNNITFTSKALITNENNIFYSPKVSAWSITHDKNIIGYLVENEPFMSNIDKYGQAHYLDAHGYDVIDNTFKTSFEKHVEYIRNGIYNITNIDLFIKNHFTPLTDGLVIKGEKYTIQAVNKFNKYTKYEIVDSDTTNIKPIKLSKSNIEKLLEEKSLFVVEDPLVKIETIFDFSQLQNLNVMKFPDGKLRTSNGMKVAADNYFVHEYTQTGKICGCMFNLSLNDGSIYLSRSGYGLSYYTLLYGLDDSSAYIEVPYSSNDITIYGYRFSLDNGHLLDIENNIRISVELMEGNKIRIPVAITSEDVEDGSYYSYVTSDSKGVLTLGKMNLSKAEPKKITDYVTDVLTPVTDVINGIDSSNADVYSYNEETFMWLYDYKIIVKKTNYITAPKTYNYDSIIKNLTNIKTSKKEIKNLYAKYNLYVDKYYSSRGELKLSNDNSTRDQEIFRKNILSYINDKKKGFVNNSVYSSNYLADMNNYITSLRNLFGNEIRLYSKLNNNLNSKTNAKYLNDLDDKIILYKPEISEFDYFIPEFTQEDEAIVKSSIADQTVYERLANYSKYSTTDQQYKYLKNQQLNHKIYTDFDKSVRYNDANAKKDEELIKKNYGKNIFGEWLCTLMESYYYNDRYNADGMSYYLNSFNEFYYDKIASAETNTSIFTDTVTNKKVFSTKNNNSDSIIKDMMKLVLNEGWKIV